jgi:hypothetical protein
MATQNEIIQQVKRAADDVRAHFSQHGSMYDLAGRKAYIRGFISSFKKYQAPDISTDTLILLFELALGIDCRE